MAISKKGNSQKDKEGSNPSLQGPPPGVPNDAMHVMQCLIEIQKDMGALSTKVDRVVDDVAKLDNHVDQVRTKIGRAEGVVIGATILLTIGAGAVWWLIGGELNQIRDQLIQLRHETQIGTGAAETITPAPADSRITPESNQ